MCWRMYVCNVCVVGCMYVMYHNVCVGGFMFVNVS